MFKKFIAPIQNWLITQNRCVGCGMPLSQGHVQKGKSGKIIVCKCKRMYRYDEVKKEYRRALFAEV